MSSGSISSNSSSYKRNNWKRAMFSQQKAVVNPPNPKPQNHQLNPQPYFQKAACSIEFPPVQDRPPKFRRLPTTFGTASGFLLRNLFFKLP